PPVPAGVPGRSPGPRGPGAGAAGGRAAARGNGARAQRPCRRLVPGRLGVRGDGRHGGLAPAAQPHGLDTAWRRRVHRPEQRCLVVHGARLPARSQASPRPGSAALAAQLGAGDHAFRAGHPAVPRWTGALAALAVGARHLSGRWRVVAGWRRDHFGRCHRRAQCPSRSRREPSDPRSPDGWRGVVGPGPEPVLYPARGVLAGLAGGPGGHLPALVRGAPPAAEMADERGRRLAGRLGAQRRVGFGYSWDSGDAGRRRLCRDRRAAGLHRGRNPEVAAIRDRPADLPDAGICGRDWAAYRPVYGTGAAGDAGAAVLLAGRGGGLDPGGGSPVQSGAAPGAAGGGQAVQPGPLRRRGDGGSVQRTPEGRGRPGCGSRGPARCCQPVPGARARLGLGQGARVMSAREGAARFRVPGAATWAGVAGAALALFAAAMVPLSFLAGGGLGVVTALVIGVPTAAVGVVVARRQPRNPLGWLLLAISACLVLSTDGPLYALLDYRFHHGRLPFGPVAVLLNGFWGSGLFLLGLVILLFPDGRLRSARWRWALRAYIVLCAFQFAALDVATVGAMVRRPIRIDVNGGLAAMEHPGGWYGAVEGPFLLVVVAFWLCFVGRQVASWRRSSGERRQQLKWLMSGAVVSLSCGFLALGTSSASGIWQAVGGIGWFGFAALPIGIGAGILKYRLYEIDRLISRTLAYAIG